MWERRGPRSPHGPSRRAGGSRSGRWSRSRGRAPSPASRARPRPPPRPSSSSPRPPPSRPPPEGGADDRDELPLHEAVDPLPEGPRGLPRVAGDPGPVSPRVPDDGVAGDPVRPAGGAPLHEAGVLGEEAGGLDLPRVALALLRELRRVDRVVAGEAGDAGPARVDDLLRRGPQRGHVDPLRVPAHDDDPREPVPDEVREDVPDVR